MTEGPGAKGVRHTFTDEELDAQLRDPHVLAWMGEHLTEVRRSVSGQRILYQSLAIGFVVGLAAHVGGYVLGSSVMTEPLGLVVDLLYALGWALWTGVIVVVFAQVIPDMKRRQVKRFLDAYEAAQRDETRTGSDQTPGDDAAYATPDDEHEGRGQAIRNARRDGPERAREQRVEQHRNNDPPKTP